MVRVHTQLFMSDNRVSVTRPAVKAVHLGAVSQVTCPAVKAVHVGAVSLVTRPAVKAVHVDAIFPGDAPTDD
jgi:hypothetical protein